MNYFGSGVLVLAFGGEGERLDFATGAFSKEIYGRIFHG